MKGILQQARILFPVCLTLTGAALLMVCVVSYKVITSPNGSQFHLNEYFEVHQPRAKRTTKYVTSSTNKTENVLPIEGKYLTIYGYDDYKAKFPDKEPTICFSKNGITKNGTLYDNFTCPMPGQSTGLTKCCPSEDSELCCRPKTKDDKVTPGPVDIAAVVSSTIAFVLALTLCMVLYCCCCQKRTGIHSGKLIWIKKRKNKTIYEEGGISLQESPDDPDEETKIIGFIPAPTDESNPQKRRKSIEGAVDRLNEYDAHSTPSSPHRHRTSSGSKPRSLGSPKQELSIPLINIQPSTPDQ